MHRSDDAHQREIAGAAAFARAAHPHLSGGGPKTDDFRQKYRAAARAYFGNLLLGLMIAGMATFGLYIVWWFINVVDAWVRPFIPAGADSYLPVATPAVGTMLALLILPRVGAYGARLLLRIAVSTDDVTLSPRMWALREFVRGAWRRRTQTSGPVPRLGLIEFPAKGVWAVVAIAEDVDAKGAAGEPPGEWVGVSIVGPAGASAAPTHIVDRNLIAFIDQPAAASS